MTIEKADLASLRINRAPKEEHGSARRLNWKWITLIIAVAILAAAYFFLRRSLGTSVEVDLTTVSLTYPSQADAVLTASGYVVAQRKAAVASKGTGRLEYLGVEEGDKVKKGQIIARLEDSDMIAALNKAKADLEVAKADQEDAEQTFLRQKKLFSSALASKADLDAAQARYDRVQATIRSMIAAQRSAEVALENTRIRAPFDGTVLTKDADVGEIVAPFASSTNSRGAVVSMADMSSLQVEADVAESNITRVSVGQPCDIVLDAYPDHRYPGVVHKIVPTADRAKATVMTKVSFKERDDKVLPEMSAKVTFLSKGTQESEASAPPVLTVASPAVVTRDGKQVVFITKDGSAVETPVLVGKKWGERTEIKEGVAKGDQVILHPDPGMTTGTRITIRSK